MTTQVVRFDKGLVIEYETLRTSALSVEIIAQPRSLTSYCLTSGGLFQWALGRQLIKQQAPVMVCQEISTAVQSTHRAESFNNGIINLIASMAIPSIIKTPRSA